MQDCCEMNPSNKLLGKMLWSCSTSMMEGEASHIYIYTCNMYQGSNCLGKWQLCKCVLGVFRCLRVRMKQHRLDVKLLVLNPRYAGELLLISSY